MTYNPVSKTNIWATTKVLGYVALVFLVLCVVEHSATIANIRHKPSTFIRTVSTKSVDFFWWCGKTVAWLSYFVFIGVWDFCVYLKDNLWWLVKRMCEQIKILWGYFARFVKWIDSILRLNEFFWGAWNIVKEMIRFVIYPLYIMGGYFVNIVQWSRSAVDVTYEAVTEYVDIPMKTSGLMSWYLMWYIMGTTGLGIAMCTICCGMVIKYYLHPKS